MPRKGLALFLLFGNPDDCVQLSSLFSSALQSNELEPESGQGQL
jgi:hypothetical protein